MTWSIQVPYRHRGESLIDVAGHARVLGQGDDRAAVARQIAIQALMDGTATTAGELLDHLEGLEPGDRRRLLDRARADLGLEPSAEIDARTRGIQRVVVESGLQSCHAPGCSAIPLTETRAWRTVNCRAWYCDEHRAGHEDDMRDLGPGLRYSEFGVLVPDIPDEAEREAAITASRQAQQQARDADRAVDAAQLRASDQARDQALQAELPPHLRRTPA
jgi:hypothetical protein